MRSIPSVVPKVGRARNALILSATVLALGAAAPGAQAAFTLNPCVGSPITGAGASFQTSAQTGFIATFQSTADGCGTSAPAVTYLSPGSGAGRRALGERGSANPTGARDAVIRFAATDDPPTAPQTDQIQKGEVLDLVSLADKTPTDDGVLHVIPVAVGAVAIDVNWPDGCAIPAALQPEVPAAGFSPRIKLTSAQVEKAFAADATGDTWGELVGPGILPLAPAVGPTDPQLIGLTCDNVPVRRVVRSDDSGTTFVMKDWMDKTNSGRGWKTAAFINAPNTAWPNTVGESLATTCPVSAAVNLCKNTAANSGGGNLLGLLTVVDGGIGYADVATSRTRGYEVSTGAIDTMFWAPIVTTASPAAGIEPVSDPSSFKAGTGVHGANCANTQFSNVPTTPVADVTLGSWATVSGVGGTAATFYPICSLTYDLAFDDNAPPFTNTPAEEAKARTVKDYLTVAVSAPAQNGLANRDYTQLPAALRTIAQTGVNAIGWNKAATTAPAPLPVTMPPPPPPPAAAVVKPSNVFSITSIKTSSTRSAASLKVSVQVPGAGALAAVATSSYKTRKKGKTKTIKVAVGKASGAATAAGTVTITIKLGSTALAALKKAKKLVVAVKVTYTPTGGSANTLAKSATLKASKKK